MSEVGTGAAAGGPGRGRRGARALHALASFVAALGGTAVVVGSVLPWLTLVLDGERAAPRRTSLASAADWAYAPAPNVTSSVAIVILAAGALTALCAMNGSRPGTVLLAAAALVASFAWVKLVMDTHPGAAVTWADLLPGAWLTLAGAAVAVVAGLGVRRGR